MTALLLALALLAPPSPREVRVGPGTALVPHGVRGTIGAGPDGVHSLEAPWLEVELDGAHGFLHRDEDLARLGLFMDRC